MARSWNLRLCRLNDLVYRLARCDSSTSHSGHEALINGLLLSPCSLSIFSYFLNRFFTFHDRLESLCNFWFPSRTHKGAISNLLLFLNFFNNSSLPNYSSIDATFVQILIGLVVNVLLCLALVEVTIHFIRN